MYQKSFHNHRRNFSINHRFRNKYHGRRYKNGIQKKFIPVVSNANIAAVSAADINPEILHKFSDFQIDKRLLDNISSHGFIKPTPIQDQAIIPALENKDVIGIAETGSGKTAAFLIPIINKIIKNRLEKALIIVPTRELAVQIRDELKILSKNLSVYSSLCIGGASINKQIFELRNKPQIVIGTPGRIKDLFTRHFLQLNTFKIIILDEADRMVDIGFLPEIKFIISHLSEFRQSLFFSATVSSEVEGIINSFVKNPVKVSVKLNDTPISIKQDVVKVKDANEKLVKLKELLRQDEFKKVLIFGRTKHGVDRLSKKLFLQGFSVDSIHGNKSQNKRLKVLSQFRESKLKILIATDIAARGLDIPDVSHVINFDEPQDHTNYIHRIGRTGRANKQGKALTFIS